MHFKAALQVNGMLIRIRTGRFTGSCRCQTCHFLKFYIKFNRFFFKNYRKILSGCKYQYIIVYTHRSVLHATAKMYDLFPLGVQQCRIISIRWCQFSLILWFWFFVAYSWDCTFVGVLVFSFNMKDNSFLICFRFVWEGCARRPQKLSHSEF